MPGDTVVVCRLDRLGRSLPELLVLVEDLAGRGFGLRSLAEQIDTTTTTTTTTTTAAASWCSTCSGRWPSSSGH
jgi:DNA invertase Pin-like site-specific DNA recombinase